MERARMRIARLALSTLAFCLVGCGEEAIPSRGANEASPPLLVCSLAADGRFVLNLRRASGLTPLMQGDLGQADPARQRAVLERLRAAMAAFLQKQEYVDEEGNCRLALRLEASPDVRWRYVQWILQAAAHLSVRLYKIEFCLPGEEAATRIDLPRAGDESYEELEDEDEGEQAVLLTDWDLHAGGALVRIRVFRCEFLDPRSARTLIKFAGKSFELPPAGRPGQPGYDTAMRAVERALSQALSALAPSAGVRISAPMPKGPHTPYGDVLHLIRHVQSSSGHRILLEGTPGPEDGWR